MKTILIVDDNSANRLALSALLEQEGYRVIEACGAAEALRTTNSQPVDLVISDLIMPEIDGYQLVRLMRDQPTTAATPVVFFSASYSQQEAGDLATSCGVLYVLPKPCEPEVIRRVVKAALQSVAPPTTAVPQEQFERTHLQVVSTKLYEKVRELEEANHALHTAGEELEGRVEERTAELAQANRHLQAEMHERMRAETDARHAKEQAEHANRAKSQFLSAMSHELRTPLNAILGFAQLLELESLNAQQRESVNHILKGGHHLLALINEVLGLAKIEAGRVDLTIEPVEINHLVQESVSLMSPVANESGVEIAEPADRPVFGTVLADRQRLKQVLLNLLSNAIKYNRKGGTVTITSRPTPHGLRISVADTGTGVSAENHARLFTPFERLGAENGRIEGTGLGLSLCKQLVESMGGSIEADSVLGQGSTFSVTIPFAANGAVH